jgi:hypothetical protein
VGPAAAGRAARAHHLAGNRVAREADANDEPFGILVFAGVRFAAFRRVQEKSAVPRSRLVCIHLRSLLSQIIGARKKSNSTAPRIKTKSGKDQRRANAT